MSDEVQRAFGLVSVYFDTTTYEMLGNRVTMEKDGQEILVSSHKILVNETLPAGAVWLDLRDLQEIQIVDDPDRVYGDLIPVVISEQELVGKTRSAYLLKEIPSGFSLEITASPQQPANEPFIYVASYRSETGNYFVIQAAIPTETEYLLQEVDEATSPRAD